MNEEFELNEEFKLMVFRKLIGRKERVNLTRAQADSMLEQAAMKLNEAIQSSGYKFELCLDMSFNPTEYILRFKYTPINLKLAVSGQVIECTICSGADAYLDMVANALPTLRNSTATLFARASSVTIGVKEYMGSELSLSTSISTVCASARSWTDSELKPIAKVIANYYVADMLIKEKFASTLQAEPTKDE